MAALSKSSSQVPEIPGRPEHVYMAAVRHYLQQDRIFWDFLRMVFAVQLAAIGGALTFAEKTAPWVFPVLLAVVAVWTILMLRVAMNTENDRDVNLETMDFLAEYLVPRQLRQELIEYVTPRKQRRLGRPWQFSRVIQWKESRHRWHVRGRTVHFWTLYTLIVVDLGLIAWLGYSAVEIMAASGNGVPG